VLRRQTMLALAQITLAILVLGLGSYLALLRPAGR
jgi:hypothetical protein